MNKHFQNGVAKAEAEINNRMMNAAPGIFDSKSGKTDHGRVVRVSKGMEVIFYPSKDEYHVFDGNEKRVGIFKDQTQATNKLNEMVK